MTANRNIASDRRSTALLLEQVVGGANPIHDVPNWLGHRGRNAAIDAALLSGTTMRQMLIHRDSVQQHLWHLNAEHGLTVVKAGDVYHLAVRPL